MASSAEETLSGEDAAAVDAAAADHPSASDPPPPTDRPPPAQADPRTQPEAEAEPFWERWFFDNPSMGRALRYTFSDKRLARAVFVNALLLVVVLAVIQEAFGRVQLGLYDASISYGRLAFLGLVAVESLVLSVLAPLGFIGMFEAERREECFDQVVTTGASPHRVVFGRYLMTLAALAVVLFSSLPFFATALILDGATVGQVLLAYVVLAAYAACLAAIACALAVGIDDAVLPAGISLLAAVTAPLGGLTLGGGDRAVFGAWSPLRHVSVDMSDIAQGILLRGFEAPAPYGVEVPTAALSLAFYAVLTLLALTYAFVGPDLELSRGLDAFDSVATTLKEEARRARRGMARTLLRTVQIRFFYENVGPRSQAVSPLLRTLGTLGLFAGAHTVFLGAIWPATAPNPGAVARHVAIPFLLFFLVTSWLLAMAGGGARSALLDRRPVLRLGPAALGRFSTLFLIVAFALVFPRALWSVAASATGLGDVMTTPTLDALYALVAGYAGFAFAVALVFAMTTTNPISATGRALIALFGANVIPLVWVPLYRGGVAEGGSAFLLDLSPLLAAFAIARPGSDIPFTRFVGDDLERYTHEPTWAPFVVFHVLVGVACLVAGVLLARREGRRAALARREDVAP